MKWLKRAVLAVVVLVLLFFGIGLVLPSGFKVQRSVEIAAPAERVYALIAAPAQWKAWSVWNQRDPAMVIQYAGPPAGAGASWSWQSKTEGNGKMDFTAVEENRKVSYQLSFPDFGMQSAGVLLIEPVGSGVRVTWTNEQPSSGTGLLDQFRAMLSAQRQALFPAPALDLDSRMGQADESVLVQAFVAQTPVEGFDVGVLVRLPGFDQRQQDLVALGPVEHCLPRELP